MKYLGRCAGMLLMLLLGAPPQELSAASGAVQKCQWVWYYTETIFFPDGEILQTRYYKFVCPPGEMA